LFVFAPSGFNTLLVDSFVASAVFASNMVFYDNGRGGEQTMMKCKQINVGDRSVRSSDDLAVSRRGCHQGASFMSGCHPAHVSKHFGPSTYDKRPRRQKQTASRSCHDDMNTFQTCMSRFTYNEIVFA
jgi:hypothetical protein